jgi:uncharacterized protein (TIGR03067 family)
MAKWISSVFLLLLLGCNDRPSAVPGQPTTTKPDPSLGDTQRIQGEWQIVERVVDGASVRTPPGKFVFHEDSMAGDGVTDMRFRLNSGTEPTSIDVFNDDWQMPLFHGIYAFRDNTLLLCQTLVSEPRPTTFESHPNDGRLLYTLRRARK